uniref:Uncharacterized protein n=1 Tax=Oryza barthii TaxID=65489 RepID=A0A0D3FU61_9ORYZ
MREVDLPPEFHVRGPPTPDWPPPPTESDEERFREDLEQYYNDGITPSPQWKRGNNASSIWRFDCAAVD